MFFIFNSLNLFFFSDWALLLSNPENKRIYFPLDGSVSPVCISAVILPVNLLAVLCIRGSNSSRSYVFSNRFFLFLPFEGSPTELFGDIFHILPRLNSDFLNTSWQTSRNIPAPRRLSKGFTSPASSPKPQASISPSPPLSPRLSAKSPHSPILSSKPSSPHSQSSGSFQIKSPNKVSPQSGSSELPSPSLSPKYLLKRCPDALERDTIIARRRMQGVATAKKSFKRKLPSPVSPDEHCSPIRPLSGTSCDDESLLHKGICNM